MTTMMLATHNLDEFVKQIGTVILETPRGPDLLWQGKTVAVSSIDAFLGPFEKVKVSSSPPRLVNLNVRFLARWPGMELCFWQGSLMQTRTRDHREAQPAIDH